MIDLSHLAPPVWHQRGLNACVPIVMCDALSIEMCQRTGVPEVFAPLFLYYFARRVAGHENRNFPLVQSSATTALAKYGLCSEALWPFDSADWRMRPNSAAIEDAAARDMPKVETLPATEDALIGSLRDQRPFWFAMRFFPSNRRPFLDGAFDVDTPLTAPNLGEAAQEVHAMLAVGYDPERGLVKVRNSFGPDWGTGGYLSIPRALLLDPACTLACHRFAPHP